MRDGLLLAVLFGGLLVLSCATAGGGSTPTAAVTPTALPTPDPSPSPPSPRSPSAVPEATDGTTPVYGYRVVRSYPHDPNAFTQGLVYTDGILYEGTGYWAQSSLRKVDLETGEVLQMVPLPPPGTFGEGITVWQDRIIQLNWQAPAVDRPNVGFVYDKIGLTLLYTFTYPTEGWGITHDGERLIMSDGSATLYFWDPDDLSEIGRVQVHDAAGQPVARLNELEFVDGLVYANVWQTDRIAIIEPDGGLVTAWIDLTGLLDDPSGHPDVLNGIAYDGQGDRLFVTGKWWPRLYEITLTRSGYLPLIAHSAP